MRIYEMKLFCILFLTFFSINSVYSFDIVQAVERAILNDPEFLAEKRLFQSKKELVFLSDSSLRPNLTINSNFTKADGSNTSSSETQSYGLTLTQSIYNKGLNITSLQSRLRVKEAEINYQIALENTIVRITSAYFDILVAQSDLKTIEAEKKAVGEQLEFAKRNFEVGTSTITDQQEAQARFDLIRASEIRTRNDLAIKRTNLEKSLLLPLPEKLTGIEKAIKFNSPQITSPSEWMTIARENNRTVAVAKIATEIAKLDLKKQKALRIPSISASVSTSYTDLDSTINTSGNNQSYGISLSAPIYSGGSISAKARESVANLLRSEQLLELKLLNADRVAGKSFRTLVAGLSQVEALEAAERSSKVALESNKLGYEVGVRINIDVLNAQKQLFSTQRDLASARYSVLESKIQLLASIGKLNIDEVKKINLLISGSN